MTLRSVFGKNVDKEHPLPQYPRMWMKRDSFYNLNGIWEYQITAENAMPFKERWNNIVVPFPLGSSLSGSEENLKPGQNLWYRRSFSFHPGSQRVILNFEAVDCICEVYLNGYLVGKHAGGYAPFSLDISRYVKYQNALMVKVTDQSDQGMYSYGKQALNPGGMFYTPQSGIWGTVWLEELPEHAVESLRITPDYDTKRVTFDIYGRFHQAVITIFDDHDHVLTGLSKDGHYVFQLDSVHPWTPEDPFLYPVRIQTEDDLIESYFGMRKYSSGYDARGVRRFMLNNRPYFISGLLDQGYSLDGGFTYPSEEAMRYEITAFKQIGFNCLRKHVKVECRRWYYLCDSLGMLVMQDMPSGGYDHYDEFRMGVLPSIGFRRLRDTGKTKFGRISKACEDNYMTELSRMLDELYNVTSVFAWVPFNEGWGQFNSGEITEYIRKKDNTRLIDAASGWFDQGNGDFLSIHDYFFPYHVSKKDQRIQILSEFGGYSYVEKDHSYPSQLYGYRKFQDKAEWNEAVFHCYETMILPNIEKGLSGCIYTQTADIEDECNGLFTADREIVKLDKERMSRMNKRLKRKIT